MNTIPSKIETNLKSIAAQIVQIAAQAQDTIKQNTSSGASSAVAAVATGEPVTVSTKLTRGRYNAMITCLNQFIALVNNQAVTQADYLSSNYNALNGSVAAAQPLSADVEAIGEKLKFLASKFISLFALAKETLDLHTTSETSLMLGAIASSNIVFGARLTKARFQLGIDMATQLSKMMNNEVVTQGTYLSTATLLSNA